VSNVSRISCASYLHTLDLHFFRVSFIRLLGGANSHIKCNKPA
jgi:hypothetical protein